MKFFTKQLYDQIRVLDFLNNLSIEPTDEKIIEEFKKFYEDKGLDYYTEEKHQYEDVYSKMKPLLLNYLPEALHPTIYNELSVYGSTLSQDLIDELKKHNKNLSHSLFSGSNLSASKMYSKHYKNIKKFLPLDMLALNKNYDFHDSKIVDFEQTTDNKIIIKLDCYGSYLPSKNLAILTFSDVKLCELEKSCLNNYWFWNETHLSNLGRFDFQALFHHYDSNGDCSLNEFRVVADTVSLSFQDNK